MSFYARVFRVTKLVEISSKPGPRLSKTFILLLLAPVVLAAISMVFFAVAGPKPPVPIMLIGGEAAVLLVLFIFLRSDGLGFGSIGLGLPQGPRSAWIEPILGFAVAPAMYLFLHFVVSPIAIYGQSAFGGFQLENLNAAPTASRLFFSVLVAPFVEEAVFRGYGITGLRSGMSALWALILTSLFFGLYHFGYGLWGMFQLAITGLLYGLVFLWRKSLPAPIASHAFVNLLLLLR